MGGTYVTHSGLEAIGYSKVVILQVDVNLFGDFDAAVAEDFTDNHNGDAFFYQSGGEKVPERVGSKVRNICFSGKLST